MGAAINTHTAITDFLNMPVWLLFKTFRALRGWAERKENNK